MLSVLRAGSPQQQLNESRPKSKTVLGRSILQRERTTDPSAADSQVRRVSSRPSIDQSTTGHRVDGKSKSARTSLSDAPFFEEDAVTVVKPSGDHTHEMRNGTAPRSTPTRRARDGQEGPWTISVAESPHDPSSYSLYVKTPTHNLTLTRAAAEIVQVHEKLRESLPGYKLPKLPLDASIVPAPPKRKSNFLNTLSRLASPAGKSAARQASGRSFSSSQPSAQASDTNTPIATPSKEAADPFSTFSGASDLTNAVESSLEHTNNISTSLAAYLTSMSNDSIVRTMRAWKRFVRVRTDDLQSVRAERAIKRVRSDLAAHSSPSAEAPRSMSQVLNDAEVSTTATASPKPSTAPVLELEAESEPETKPVADSSVADASEADKEGQAEIEGEKTEQESVKHEEVAPAGVEETVEDVGDGAADARGKTPTPPLEGIEADEDTNGRSTPVPSEVTSIKASRITRSQSAEPSSRASRIYSTSALRDGASSTTSITEDDSSISTTGRRSRKKRSKSTDPNASLEKKKSQRKVVVDDFEMMRVLGKGCAGKVLLVRHKTSSDVYALKAITKRHVLAHQELQHTLTEQAVLKRMAAEGTDPFVVKLWWSFHDKEHLFLVMDFHPGGDLATQLARWGRLGRDRARFYAAEIVEGVDGLHAAGVIYRDLKPENILIGADGHIVLTDFGLSKEFPRRTSAITAPPTPSGSRNEFLSGSSTPVTASPPWMKGEAPQTNPWTGANDTTTTFCGTAEYLAPEVIQGLPYSYEVDWWSFGTMLFEMLTGITPFWANNHSDMYYRVLQDELQFPDDKAMDQDTKSLIRGLLQRNPALRIKEPRIKKHPYFGMIEWSHVYHKRYIPPYIPPIDPSNASDTQNFDDTFLDMEPVIKDEEDGDQTDTDPQTDNERTDEEDSATTPSQSRSSSVHPVEEDDTLFDGYSFKGRHSIIIDDDEEEGDESGEEEEEEGDGSSIATTELDGSLRHKPSTDAVSAGDVSGEITTVEEVPEPEPATPEATSPPKHEEGDAIVDSKTPVEAKHPEPLAAAEESTPVGSTADQPPTPVEKEVPAVPAPAPSAAAQETIVVKAPVPRSGTTRTRARREKSGIPALDRAYAGEESAPERDEEDDDWDFVETNVDEERNGAKPNSLFARGVVDRYKLAVFRKSTPKRDTRRNVSSVSDLGSPSESSPTPVEKRRGRNPGLTFRRNPKEFLRAKSPPRTPASTKSSVPPSASATLSAASTASTSALLTPSPSVAPSLPVTPSLKSKESAISMGAPSESSDQSVNGELRTPLDTSRAASTINIEEKQKSKGLKKYKEGAEKVLSIFQSPR